MVKIILLGPPGSGKGTQAAMLCKKLSISHISTGEILRQAMFNNTELGRIAKQAIDSGQLVNDKIIIDLIKEKIYQLNEAGYLLDGFPRNILQSQSLDLNFIDAIIYLDVPDNILIERLSGRRYHPNSGRIYHIKYNPPQELGLDDITKEPLVIRDDDQLDVIQKRLIVYHQSTKDVINWYESSQSKKFIKIDGKNDKNEIFNQILNFIM